MGGLKAIKARELLLAGIRITLAEKEYKDNVSRLFFPHA